MTRDEAIKRAKKLLGPKAFVEAGERLSSPEERATNTGRIKAVRARRQEISEEINRRLKLEPWWQALHAEDQRLHTELKGLYPIPYYKFRVGHVDTMLGWRHSSGEGDTWEQAFEKAEKNGKGA